MKRIILDSIDSTNTYAEKRREDLTENTLIIAKEQTSGRGQYDREWYSEPTKSITISFLIKNATDEILQQIPSLVSDAINDLYAINSKIIPPNDIYIDDKKVCGLLIETFVKSNQIEDAIIGIGLNLNNDTFPKYLSNKATSVKLTTGKPEDANLLINTLENRIEYLYA